MFCMLFTWEVHAEPFPTVPRAYKKHISPGIFKNEFYLVVFVVG